VAVSEAWPSMMCVGFLVTLTLSSDFRLQIFDSGVMVIELQSHNEEEMVASALETVSELHFLQIVLGKFKRIRYKNVKYRISF